MEQLLAHAWGDYILQTNKMATLKRASFSQAILHAVTYSFFFLFLTKSAAALLVIIGTHALIDHCGLARYVVRWKNTLGDWSHRDEYITPTGYPEYVPPYMAFWLLIIADNTLHLTINFFALRYL